MNVIYYENNNQGCLNDEYWCGNWKIEFKKTTIELREETIDVADMFRAIIEDRKTSKVEKVTDGHTGLLFNDENNMQLMAMHL